ncbi:uncharacterized protein LOC132043277 [Lycium ferocissimum]|uniref:uncharacterized protein LOC132043277 n=1 Tax=Lycium ferocissimum TaxID=112874 RepID=UPI0028161347|nr:uncharacterized protein LOC132043277 [Lycium ferocissimum]
MRIEIENENTGAIRTVKEKQWAENNEEEDRVKEQAGQKNKVNIKGNSNEEQKNKEGKADANKDDEIERQKQNNQTIHSDKQKQEEQGENVVVQHKTIEQDDAVDTKGPAQQECHNSEGKQSKEEDNAPDNMIEIIIKEKVHIEEKKKETDRQHVSQHIEIQDNANSGEEQPKDIIYEEEEVPEEPPDGKKVEEQLTAFEFQVHQMENSAKSIETENI